MGIEAKFKELKAKVFGVEPIMEIGQLGRLEIEILKSVTGHATHRFSVGRPSMEQIIGDWEVAVKQGRVSEKPEAYTPYQVKMSNVEVQADLADVEADYRVLSSNVEIALRVVETGNITPLVEQSVTLFETKKERIENSLSNPSSEKAANKMRQDIASIDEQIASIQEVNSIDQLIQKLVAFKFDKGDLDGVGEILRSAVLAHVFLQESAYPNQMAGIGEQEISFSRVQELANLLRDPIKEHVISPERGHLDINDINFALKVFDGDWRDVQAQLYKNVNKALEKFPDTYTPGHNRLQKLKKSIEDAQSLESVNSLIEEIQKIGGGEMNFNLLRKRLLLIDLLGQSSVNLNEVQMEAERKQVSSSVVSIISNSRQASLFGLRDDPLALSEETMKAIHNNKVVRKEVWNKLFDTYQESFNEVIASATVVQGEGKQTVMIIPDRGVVGEMAGYLADVCYTKEYPLIPGREDKEGLVIPYKFVTVENGEPRFIGSVLLFETIDAKGQPALMVRGFDIPQEGQIDIPNFIETFLNQMMDVARQRGAKNVLLPGVQGAISNYSMTINHMYAHYIDGKQPVSLGRGFAFNGYDLTHNSYVARLVIEPATLPTAS